MAKILFANKRASQETCTAILFIPTRVSELDNDKWAKLVQLMKYIRGKRNLPLILCANGSGIIKWWICELFAEYPNMRGHTGGGL